ncbi:MAG: glycoside hydrolase family 3 protein [Acidobacteria bacterium]|nr:glycoside hydrolase family 3 protein [Acidobacteriota bacterium]MCB9396859.1 glycoside hydrolase family 3 protein [Acidobacteriota bacterium]
MLRLPLIVGFQGLEPDWVWLERVRPAGVILFTRNFQDLEQLRKLTLDLHRFDPHLFIVIDQEGGRVNRLKTLLGEFPGPPSMHTPEIARQNGYVMGQLLRSLAIDFNFAPVIDLNYGNPGNALDLRYLGSDPEEVALKAVAYVKGLRKAGIEGCLKHFPGLGSTIPDSHFHLPTLELPESQWQQQEAKVYQRCAQLGMHNVPIMVGHCTIPFWDQEIATLSGHTAKAAQALGHQGMLISDDFEMKALDQTRLPELTLQALENGLDLVIVCHRADLIESIADALREQPQILAQKHQRINTFDQHLVQLKAQSPQPPFEKALADWQAFASGSQSEQQDFHAFLDT